MKKIEMNKKTIITIVATALLIIAVIVGLVMCGKKDNTGSDKDKTGKDNVKTEQNDDASQDDTDKEKGEEGGIQILGPDEADKQENSNNVEFVGPDGTGSGNTTGNGTGSGNTTGNGTDSGDTTGNETTDGDKDKDDKEENPDEDIEDKDKYGELF